MEMAKKKYADIHALKDKAAFLNVDLVVVSL